MCQGTVTTLLCGHNLVHFSVRCDRGCEEPQGPRHQLADTCARCHSAFSPASINETYGRQREDLTEQLRRVAPGSADAIALARLINSLQVQQMEALARAARLGRRSGPVDVLWPGKMDEYEADILAGVTGIHGRYLSLTSDSGS